MEVLHAHCAGLDVHKDTVVACVRHMVSGKVTTTVKTFNTATAELLALSDRLSAEDVTTLRWKLRAFTGSRSGTFFLIEILSWCLVAAHTQATCTGVNQSHTAYPKDVGVRQYQTGFCDQQCRRSFWPTHA
jgi:hypothetical protein